MKKRFWGKKLQNKVLALLLTATMFSSSVPDAGLTLQAQVASTTTTAITTETDVANATGSDADTNDMVHGEGDMTPIRTDGEISTDADACEDISSNSCDTDTYEALPSSVDNSTLKYFPAIGNQGSIGSCTCWAEVYYAFTFASCKARDVAATGKNVMSPAFIYNKARSNASSLSSSGTNSYTIFHLLTDIGTPSNTSVNFSMDSSCNSWFPTQEIWKEAMKNRMHNYTSLSTPKTITSPTDSDLDVMKRYLANEQLITYTTYFNWTYTTIPNGYPHAGEYIATQSKYKPSTHRMTIVGYDDSIWVDINKDGVVQEAEKGAFKIANSWGTSYKNSGFCWVSYDALNETSQALETSASTREPIFLSLLVQNVPDQDTSDVALVTTLNTADRSQLNFKITATSKANNCTDSYSVYPFSTRNWNQVSLNGKTSADDGTLVLDLNNVIEDITLDTLDAYDWNVTIEDTIADGTAVIVKQLDLVNTDGKTLYQADLNESNDTLDGDLATWTLQRANQPTPTVTPTTAPTATPTTTPTATPHCDEQIVYFDNSVSKWSSVNAYIWGSGLDTKAIQGSQIASNIYKIEVPKGYVNIIFKNTSGTSSWDKQTSDLTIPANRTNCFVASSSSNKAGGSWYSYAPSTPTPTIKPTATPTVKPTATPTAGTALYFDNTNANWSSVYAYVWSDGVSASVLETTKVEDNIYKVNVPTKYQKILFKNTQNGWDKQTNDFLIPTGTQNCWKPDAGYNKASGNWYSYKEANTFSVELSLYGKKANVNAKATVSNGTAPYTYTFTDSFNGEKRTPCTTTNYNSNYYTHTLSAYVGGYYGSTVTVTDAEGKVATASAYLQVGSLAITSITPSITPGIVGERVSFTATYENVFFYKFPNAGEWSITDSNGAYVGSSDSFTPTKAGTYYVTYTLTDASGETASKTISYVVKDTASNLATIYYKSSWSTAYIHYCIQNGSWTNVPGVQMKASDRDGYNWMYTIDLGEQTGASVCFNNGNGSWDSRNSSNYSVGVGNYAVQDGSITRLD